MRITGGVFRSRALVAPRGQETRPTSDRVREALFSMLTSDGVFENDALRVLDLYAGSGALAFEALSRGAVSATLVEHARPAIAAIRENADALGVSEQVTLVTRACERALGGISGDFALILVDPPYAEVRAKGFSGVLAEASRLLVTGGVLVLEHDAKDEPPAPESLLIDRQRRHGDTTLSLFRRA
jgi:16S rRNA (guanine966-N2)-methyltransferase